VKISVIIPVYNVEKYLKECLQSVLNQTLCDIEVICVNDGSSDGSLDILESFAGKDGRVKVLNRQKSAGAAAARNEALRIASGEYVGFVDSDDWIDCNFYEVLYNRAKEKNADVVRSSYNYYFGNTEKESELNKIIAKRYTENSYLGVNEHSVVIWNAIYRKRFLIDRNIYYFDEDLLRSNDVPFTARVTLAGGKMAPVTGTNYHYRRNIKNRLTTFTIGRAEDVMKANEKVIDALNTSDVCREDYLEAFYRCIWRFDFIFSKALQIKGFCKIRSYNYAERIIESFIKCKYPDDFFAKYNKRYTKFLAGNDIFGYIKEKLKFPRNIFYSVDAETSVNVFILGKRFKINKQ